VDAACHEHDPTLCLGFDRIHVVARMLQLLSRDSCLARKMQQGEKALSETCVHIEGA